MLSIAALSAVHGNYYLKLAREDYYLRGGEPRGLYLGEGAEALGLTGLVDEKECKRLLDGFSPDGKDPLTQNAGDPKHQAGWDLTFSARRYATPWSQLPTDACLRMVAALRERSRNVA